MANGGGINVGDAVLNFVADTTQLDQAYAKAGAEATSKLAPVQNAANQVGQAMERAGTQAQQASAKMVTGFQAITREGQTWANFFKVNMPAAFAFTGSAVEAMKLVGAEWQKLRAETAQGLDLKVNTGSVGTAKIQADIVATKEAVKQASAAYDGLTTAQANFNESQARVKALTDQLASGSLPASAEAVRALAVAQQEAANAATNLIAAESAVGETVVGAQTAAAEAIDKTTVAVKGSEVSVNEAATMWDRMGAVVVQVATGQRAINDQLAKAATATSAAATATERETVAYQELTAAQAKHIEAQQRVQAILQQLQSGQLPQTSKSIQDLSVAQQTAAESAVKLAAAEAKIGEATAPIKNATGTVENLNKEITAGSTVGLGGWINKLPILGNLMETAFEASTVLLVIGLLIDGLAHLKDWTEQAEILREAWTKIDEQFASTTDGIKEQIDEQEQKFIELTQGPVAALDFAFTHMKSTAQDTLQSITADTKAASDQLKNQDGLFAVFEHFNFKDASKDLDRFVTDLTLGMRKAKEANPGDVLAQYREGQRLTQDQIAKVNEAIKAQEKVIAERQAIARLNGELELDTFKSTLEPLQKELDLLNKINDEIKSGTTLDEDRAKVAKKTADEAAVQLAQQLGEARIDAQRTTGRARIALEQEQNSEFYQQGQRSYAAYLELVRKYRDDEYNLERSSLQRKLALQQTDPIRNAAAIIATNGQLRALEITHQEDILKIDQDAYRKQAADSVAAIQQQITATKQGSQARVDQEQLLAQFLKVTYGEESAAYQAQLNKVLEAERAHSDQLVRIAQAQVQADKALFDERRQAASTFYQWEAQTSRITQAELLNLQHQNDTATFNDRRADLKRQLASLGADELEAKTRVQGQLDLLDQQQIDKERQYRRQLADVQDTYFQELGIKSEAEVQREVAIEQQAFDKIKASGTASYIEILRAKEALLNSQITLAKLLGDENEFQRLTALLAQVEKSLYDLGVTGSKSYNSISAAMDAFTQRLVKQRGELHGTQAVFNTAMLDMTNVMAGAVQAWILGQASLGNALRQGLAAELATIAGKAAAWALYFTAWGIADIFWNPARAGADFTAAAEFAAVAAFAGAAAYGIRPGNKNDGQNPAQTTQASGITQGPTRLGTGGIVNKRQLVMLGDDPSGTTDSPEAVIPLRSTAALKSIADALGPYVQAQPALLSASARGTINDAGRPAQRQGANDTTFHQSGDEVHYHDYRTTSVVVEGMISDDKMSAVVRKINRLVKNSDVQLTASNARRITKRS